MSLNVKDLIELNEKKDLLTALYHHFNSQAKTNTPKCSSSYNKDLANKCFDLAKIIDRLIE